MFLMSHSSEEKDLPLRADSDHKRDQWLKVVTKACLEYMTTKKKMEREKMELSECRVNWCVWCGSVIGVYS